MCASTNGVTAWPVTPASVAAARPASMSASACSRDSADSAGGGFAITTAVAPSSQWMRHSAAAWSVARVLGKDASTSLLLGVSLSQIGEFSFILAGLGVSLGILPAEGRDLILAGAILSIIANPLLFVLHDRVAARLARGWDVIAGSWGP